MLVLNRVFFAEFSFPPEGRSIRKNTRILMTAYYIWKILKGSCASKHRFQLRTKAYHRK